MDNKKDIYNLWVQYTTKNNELYFREFIERFVAIWKGQLALDFSNDCPAWNEVRPDSGPHLGRLPDELLPAIGKFIIIARDNCENNGLTDEQTRQIAVLVDCLVIICRHFENILAVIKYEYKSNLIAILFCVYKQIIERKHVTPDDVHLFRSFSQFLEVMYDPYLTWRSFLRGNNANYQQLSYKPHAIHVEIIPFIYDCFQHDDITKFPEIGESLVHTLGAIMCGSQKCLKSVRTKTETSAFGEGNENCDNLRNGMRAICPATVSVIVKILSKWETRNEIRAIALKCCALMVVVLQKSSPEERQIDLVTLIQLYCDVIQGLLSSDQFSNQNEAFEIADDDPESSADVPLDVNALKMTLANITSFFPDNASPTSICEAITETTLVDLIISIPRQIKDWNFKCSDVLLSDLEAFSTIVYHSPRIVDHLRAYDKLEKFMKSLKVHGMPTEDLLRACFHLAYNENDRRLVLPEVIVSLIEWIPEMPEREQTFLSALILKGCTENNLTKSAACEYRTVKALCESLLQFSKLSDACIQNSIKLIEELSKMSITPIELKRVFGLLREESGFPQSKQLLQTLVTVSLQTSLTTNNLCLQYLTINNESDGIIVPDIKNWSMSGSYGFIFHILIRLNTKLTNDGKKLCNGNDQPNQRRMLFNLRTASNTGFEVFVQSSGNIVVAAITRREYLTTVVQTKTLLDAQWHYVTVAITPPKRPFSYSQINVFIDCIQKLSATLKVQAISEPFTFCAIGSATMSVVVSGQESGAATTTTTNPVNALRSSRSNSTQAAAAASSSATTTAAASSYKGMLPSLLERTLSTNVSNYFTLPLRTQTTSFDPNVKNFPYGMQDTVFGEPSCLHGQIAGVLLAEPSTSLKTVFDAGLNFASIFSQDNDMLELTSRFVFCYAAGAFWQDNCLDLIPSGRYPSIVEARHCKIVKMQDTINSIGGIQAILPILHRITKEESKEFSLANLQSSTTMETSENESEPLSKTPTAAEFADWEVLSSSNLYTEWKMIQHPVASFICFLRYLIHEHDNNQENMLNSDCLSMIGLMFHKIPPHLFDVNALMATHLLIETLQNHKSNMSNTGSGGGSGSGGSGSGSTGGRSTTSLLLEVLYTDIVFNFHIWSRMQFQITLGHVQYLNAMVKNDRKYFRKKFGILYFLDVVRQHYAAPEHINPDDARTIRSTLFAIVRFFLLKDVNIKEISVIIAFFASVRQDRILKEFLQLLTLHVQGKSCKDQMILLLHEPQTTNLLYNFLIDKSYSTQVKEAAMRLICSLLSNSCVQQRYKQNLRLYDSSNEHCSLFPGLFSYMTPCMTLSSTIIFNLFDEMLNGQDCAGVIFLVHHLSNRELHIKLEIAKRLERKSFMKESLSQAIAKQTGWQESIARLLIRRPLTNVKPDEEKRKSFGINLDVLLEDNNDFANQADLISFCEQHVKLGEEHQMGQMDQSDSGLILNEIQASVTEAANAIESEIKELAESVSGVVVENVNSVFSVIRQTTHDIQDTFESLTLGSSADSESLSRQRTESMSSDSSQSQQISSSSSCDESSVACADADAEAGEQLVNAVSNILFTVFWHGVSNDHPQCWKERGQVLGCINLLALNNELLASHLKIRLIILEMAVEASIHDLSEHGNQTLINQENASQVLRMVYDLVVLGSNEDESKKCSTRLLDDVLRLLDSLMVFQHGSDDWSDMIRLCLGLLLKCSRHPDAGVVAMATAKLHAIIQSRSVEDPGELSYLLFCINRALDTAIEAGNPEEYSFLMPVMKALLEKCRYIFNLDANLPDLPPTSSGPVFFHDFQMYSTSKKWRTFIERIVKPLFDVYQREIELNLWEPINRYWAECYEACKAASVKRNAFQAENRRQFQQKIVMPWKVRQMEETARLNAATLVQKTKTCHIKKKWKMAKRFLYGPRGPWFTGKPAEEYWKLSNHENVARMRLKLEPQLYPEKHENAANLRDNATNACDPRELTEFDSKIKNAVVPDFLADDESQQLEEELRQTIESQSQQDVPLEKSVISQDCELITLMTKVKGKIEVNQTLFTFIDMNPPLEDGSKYDFRFSLNKIREVHLRKFNLRRSALEIFLVDQTSYFLNFSTKTRNKIFTKILSLQPPNILYGLGRSPAVLLRSSGLTQKWVNREISNFEYLMCLNTIAGRSYNDLSQYPVFPWILSDYTSDILDLTDPKSFRDLSKPVGVINPNNEAEVRSKYESFEDPSGTIPKFHYGTHYSNSAGVLHYLLRVEPFTSLHIELQSGRFDVADRQFHSIPQTWKLLMDNPNDVKELIPEFFYFPEFLKNMNKFDLGHLQITKEVVDDVILPPWATTPEEFIAIHRRALESEYVSQNLHHWIDLIFGYKQKGPKSVEALNVFYYCSYEGAVDLDKITNPIEREAVEGMINNFGQVPSQLMREPHPRRLSHDETMLKLLRAELKRPDITMFLDKVAQYYCDLSPPKDPIIFLSTPRSPPRSFLQLSPDVLVSISRSCILGCNSWMPYDKEQGFLLEIDATTTNMKNRKRVFGPLHPSQLPHSQLFAVSIDGKLLYVGGIWDNSLRVYNLNKGKAVASVTRHLDIITCLALDSCGSYLVTGSRDCTCVIWSIQTHQYGGAATSNIPVHALTGQAHLQAVNQLNTQNVFSPKPLTTLYGHDNAISSVAIYTELDMVVSGSLDGTVNVYTLQDGQFVRTLKPIGCTDFCVQISFVTVSYHGHIAFSALDDTSHSVHVYSINGTSLGSKYVSGRVTGLTTASDYLVVADDAGDITMSRLHGLKPIFDIPLHVPIQTVVVTPGNTHILAPLRDGRLAVIAVHVPSSSSKKHSVLNV